MSVATGHHSSGRGRHTRRFAFSTGELVLVKWDDGMVYFAKIKRIDQKREKCTVVFDDKSQDEADFSQIHSVDETTTDIICIKCKKDNSDSPNEIVLCDMCGIGFHQKCHTPPIPASALQLDSPWNCCYCQRGVKCPFLTESLDVLQNLLSDTEATTGEEDEGGTESEYYDDAGKEESTLRPRGRKRKGKRICENQGTRQERKSLRLNVATPESSLATTERRSGHVGPHVVERKGAPSSLPLGKSPLDNSRSQSENVALARRKRKKHHAPAAVHQKRLKRSSVESRTVSVTRIDTPIYENGVGSLFPHGSPGRSALSPVFSPTGSKSLAKETSDDLESDKKDTSISRSVSPAIKSPKLKQRQFRVSLSLPDEVEKRHQDKIIPSWDEICSPERSPSTEKDSCFSSPKSASPEAKKPEQDHVAFVASPLPTTIKKLDVSLLKKPETKRQLEMSDVIKRRSSESSDSSNHDKPIEVVTPSALKDKSADKSKKSPVLADASKKTLQSPPAAATSKAKISGPPSSDKSKIDSAESATAATSNATGVSPTSDPATTTTNSMPASVVCADATSKTAEQSLSADLASIVSSVCSSYLSSSRMDVGVTGKPVQTKPRAATTNPVVVGSIKVPPHSPSKESVLSSLDSSDNKDHSSSTPPGSQSSVGKTQEPPVTSVITPQNQTGECGGDSVAPGAQPPIQMADEIEALVAEATCGSGGQGKVVGSPTRTGSVSSDPATAPVKQRPSVLLKEKHAGTLGMPEAGSAAAPTSVITKTPQQQQQQQQQKEAAVASADKNSAPADPSRIQSSKIRKLSSSTIISPAPRQHSVSSPTTTARTPNTPPTKSRVFSPSKPPKDSVPLPEKPKPATISTPKGNQGENNDNITSQAARAGEPDDVIITAVEPSNTGKAITSHFSPQHELGPKEVSSTSELKAGRPPSHLPHPAMQASHGTTAEQSVTGYYHGKPHVTKQQQQSSKDGGGGSSLPPPPPTSSPPSTTAAMPVIVSRTHAAQIPGQTTAAAAAAAAVVAAAGETHRSKAVLRHSSGPPVASSPHVPLGKSGGAHPSSVTTTKPYAIVNAIPSQSVDAGYKSIALPQKVGMSEVVAAGGGGGRGMEVGGAGGKQHVICMVSSAGTAQLVAGSVSQSGGMLPTTASIGGGNSVTTPPTLHPQVPPPPYSAHALVTKQTSVPDLELESIQKRIGDAFTQSSEAMLVSAFEDAWKKFQANEKLYEGKEKEGGAKGIVARGPAHSLVHQKPRVIAPKPHSEQIQLSPSVGTATAAQYIHASHVQSTPLSQPQLLLQPVSSEYTTVYAIPASHSGHPVQLYYPAAAAAAVETPTQSDPAGLAARHTATSKSIHPPPPPPLPVSLPVSAPASIAPVPAAQQHRIVSSKSVLPPPSRVITTASPRRPPHSSKVGPAGQKSAKRCALCGKGATYLCSGCRVEWYCGRDCQLKSWATHSDQCHA